MWKLIVLTAGVLLAIPALAEEPLPMNIVGRVLPAESKGIHSLTYQWPAIYFESRFTGDQVTVRFDDFSNNFNLVVDGKLLMIVLKPGKQDWQLDHLGAGPHSIRLEKRSETQYATGRFGGFYVPDTTAILPAPNQARQIEFIGDSLTVGYGNTSAFSQCTPEEIFETTDAQQGFGPLTAKHFDADYQINAFSGLGMVRNYDGREHPKYHMPMLYDRAIFDDPTPAKQPANEPIWHPQVIVIGIGGNDFSTPVRPDERWKTEAGLRADYVKTYTAFVKTIRARHPNALIILATPPGREEGYSGGTDDVFAAIKAGGDTNIDRVTLPVLDKIGCNGHPSTRADARVADFYIKYLTDHPQVWQGK